MRDSFYLQWQKRMKVHAWYRYAWVFLGIYSVLAVFAVGAVLIARHEMRIIVVAVTAFVIARAILSPLIYLFYKKARPYQRLHLGTVFSRFLSNSQTLSNSFPSDHALSLAAISFVFFWYNPTLGLWMFLLTVVNGCARVVLGYHDEWDVLGGWTIGVIAALTAIYWIAPVVFTRV